MSDLDPEEGERESEIDDEEMEPEEGEKGKIDPDEEVELPDCDGSPDEVVSFSQIASPSEMSAVSFKSRLRSERSTSDHFQTGRTLGPLGTVVEDHGKRHEAEGNRIVSPSISCASTWSRTGPAQCANLPTI